MNDAEKIAKIRELIDNDNKQWLNSDDDMTEFDEGIQEAYFYVKRILDQ